MTRKRKPMSLREARDSNSTGGQAPSTNNIEPKHLKVLRLGGWTPVVISDRLALWMPQDGMGLYTTEDAVRIEKGRPPLSDGGDDPLPYGKPPPMVSTSKRAEGRASSVCETSWDKKANKLVRHNRAWRRRNNKSSS